ncbi:MAG: serine hydrolase domain-containing protein [Bacteroidota bacterium]
MRKIALFSLIPLILFIVNCSQVSDKIEAYPGYDISESEMEEYLMGKMEDFDIPGMSIAFINEGKVVSHKVYGYAHREENKSVDEKTIFEAASLSKPLFVYFVMKYVEAGKLDLDKPLYEFLPYPDIADDERYKQITARMVLSHRSGFPNWRGDYPENKLFIQFDPGTDYFYSGEGYQYLAKVLKEIDNTDWEGLETNFQKLVAEPLGMEHTVFIQDAYAQEHKAEPYDKDGEWISPDRDGERELRFQFIAPASIHTEALDFSKWLIALMNYEGLEKESFEELFKVHSYVDEFEGIKVDYTLGFFHPRIPLSNIYLHGGNNYGFTCSFAIDPDKDWGFVLFTNSEYGEDLGNELLLAMLTGLNNETIFYILGFGLGILLIIIFLFFRFKKRRKIKKVG